MIRSQQAHWALPMLTIMADQRMKAADKDM